MSYWVWIFGDIAGLRWVLDHRCMAFASHAGSRARRIRKGDQAVLYVTRGAHNNPTRDRAHLAGLVMVASDCQADDPIEIAGREFNWTCRILPDVVLPERAGPPVHEFVGKLEHVKRPEVWGQYFRQSPVELSGADFAVLETAIKEW